jgi:hypothetical protein
MNINDVLKSRFVKPYDLQGREPVVIIAKVVIEPVGWGKAQTQEPVIYFAGKDKGLKANATILRAIAGFAGDEMDRWVGVSVQLYTTTDRNPKNGLQVPVVRIKAPSRQPQLVQKAGPR